jgi:hypothetical protein
MLSVAKPLHTARSTLELCANHVQDQAKSIRLHGIATVVEAAEIDYLAKGETTPDPANPTCWRMGQRRRDGESVHR